MTPKIKLKLIVQMLLCLKLPCIEMTTDVPGLAKESPVSPLQVFAMHLDSLQ